MRKEDYAHSLCSGTLLTTSSLAVKPVTGFNTPSGLCFEIVKDRLSLVERQRWFEQKVIALLKRFNIIVVVRCVFGLPRPVFSHLDLLHTSDVTILRLLSPRCQALSNIRLNAMSHIEQLTSTGFVIL